MLLEVVHILRNYGTFYPPPPLIIKRNHGSTPLFFKSWCLCYVFTAQPSLLNPSNIFWFILKLFKITLNIHWVHEQYRTTIYIIYIGWQIQSSVTPSLLPPWHLIKLFFLSDMIKFPFRLLPADVHLLQGSIEPGQYWTRNQGLHPDFTIHRTRFQCNFTCLIFQPNLVSLNVYCPTKSTKTFQPWHLKL